MELKKRKNGTKTHKKWHKRGKNGAKKEKKEKYSEEGEQKRDCDRIKRRQYILFYKLTVLLFIIIILGDK